MRQGPLRALSSAHGERGQGGGTWLSELSPGFPCSGALLSFEVQVLGWGWGFCQEAGLSRQWGWALPLRRAAKGLCSGIWNGCSRKGEGAAPWHQEDFLPREDHEGPVPQPRLTPGLEQGWWGQACGPMCGGAPGDRSLSPPATPCPALTFPTPGSGRGPLDPLPPTLQMAKSRSQERSPG